MELQDSGGLKGQQAQGQFRSSFGIGTGLGGHWGVIHVWAGSRGSESRGVRGTGVVGTKWGQKGLRVRAGLGDAGHVEDGQIGLRGNRMSRWAMGSWRDEVAGTTQGLDPALG